MSDYVWLQAKFFPPPPIFLTWHLILSVSMRWFHSHIKIQSLIIIGHLVAVSAKVEGSDDRKTDFTDHKNNTIFKIFKKSNMTPKMASYLPKAKILSSDWSNSYRSVQEQYIENLQLSYTLFFIVDRKLMMYTFTWTPTKILFFIGTVLK